MVTVQRGGGRQRACLEPGSGARRGDLAARPGQPDDQLALHQVDELQQHGGSGCGAGPHHRREGDLSSDTHRPLGFPLCRDGLARHLCRRRACRARPVAGDPDRGAPSPGAGGGGPRRGRLRRRLLVLSLGGAGGGGRNRSAPGRSVTALDGDRRAGVRGRAVEQLRVPFDRHDGRAARGQPRKPGADHRQRRLPHQAQLRGLRHRAAAPGIPLAGRAIRGRCRADAAAGGGVHRHWHGGIVDHAGGP